MYPCCLKVFRWSCGISVLFQQPHEASRNPYMDRSIWPMSDGSSDTGILLVCSKWFMTGVPWFMMWLDYLNFIGWVEHGLGHGKIRIWHFESFICFFQLWPNGGRPTTLFVMATGHHRKVQKLLRLQSNMLEYCLHELRQLLSEKFPSGTQLTLTDPYSRLFLKNDKVWVFCSGLPYLPNFADHESCPNSQEAIKIITSCPAATRLKSNPMSESDFASLQAITVIKVLALALTLGLLSGFKKG